MAPGARELRAPPMRLEGPDEVRADRAILAPDMLVARR